jgi:hypothetical protein
MKKAFSLALAACLLMSFHIVDSKPKTTQQTEQHFNCSFVISGELMPGYSEGWVIVTVTAANGDFLGSIPIFSNSNFSTVIPVNTSTGTVTATIQSNGFIVRINGAPMVCQNGVTQVFFSQDCVFWGGSCENTP